MRRSRHAHRLMARSNPLLQLVKAMSKDFQVPNSQVLKVLAGIELVQRDAAGHSLPALFALKLSRIADACAKEAKLIIKHRQEIVDKYTEWDSEDVEKRKAKPVVQDGKEVPGSVLLTDPKKFADEEETFLDAEATIKAPVVTEEELKELKLPVATVRALLPFMEVKSD